MSEIYTTTEAARLIKVHPETMRDLINSGQIDATNVARNPLGQPRYRIDAEEIERFLRARKKAAVPKSRRRSKVKRVWT